MHWQPWQGAPLHNGDGLSGCQCAPLHHLFTGTFGCGRFAEPACKNLATKDLKQRPGTVKRVADVFALFVELEQADAVLVRHGCALGRHGKLELAAVP